MAFPSFACQVEQYHRFVVALSGTVDVKLLSPIFQAE
jgi:hypothetical protein